MKKIGFIYILSAVVALFAGFYGIPEYGVRLSNLCFFGSSACFIVAFVCFLPEHKNKK